MRCSLNIPRRRLGAVLAVTVAACALAACASTGTSPGTALGTQQPTTTPESSAPVATPSPVPSPVCCTAPSPTQLTLGPTGYGALALGMTVDQAEATGLMTQMSGSPAAGCDSSTHLVGTVAGPTEESGALFFSQDMGLIAIYAYPGLKTPEGIGLGSTYQQVHAAYPEWQGLEGTSGRGSAKASGNASYRIVIDGSTKKVIELDVQLNDQDCYE